MRKYKTSQTHPLQISSFACGAGRVGLSMCPGKHQPKSRSGPWDRSLIDDLKAVYDWGASTVLSLIEVHEFKSLDVESLPHACTQLGMAWLWAPIQDVHAPGAAFDVQWRLHSRTLHVALLRGERVFVHCMGGLGRAGTVAAELLMLVDELPASVAIDVVRGARGDAAIETLEQELWLERKR